MSIDAERAPSVTASPPVWLERVELLWSRRTFLLRTAAIAMLLSLGIAFTLPKSYKSSARIMPPNNAASGGAMLAALAGRALGGLSGLSGLAGGLLGGYNATSVTVDLLRSGTIADNLITRYDLQQVYGKRFRSDTAKALAKHTTIADDKKSGIVTVTVEDHDPRRARDLTQGYLDELDLLVNRTGNSSARQERMFIESRLTSVRKDLDTAQERLSQFASTHTAIDLKEQTRASVDVAARVQAQRIVEEANIDSLRQVYGDENVRVRSAQARIAVLDAQLAKVGGNADPLTADGRSSSSEVDAGTALSPSLRQLPRLAVPYANLYREVRIQETVFELLTQQYELARIQEAKNIPVISVVDAPGVPDKKSSPPRLLLTLALTAFAVSAAAVLLLLQHAWQGIEADDERKLLVRRVVGEWRSKTAISASGR